MAKASLSREQYDKLGPEAKKQLGPYEEAPAKLRTVKADERPTPKERTAKGPGNPPTRPPDPPRQVVQRAARYQRESANVRKPVPAKAPVKAAPRPVRVVSSPSGKRRLVTPISGGGVQVSDTDQVALIAGAVVLLVLYVRGVPQNLWKAAVGGPGTPAKQSTAVPPASGGSAPPPAGGGGTGNGTGLAAAANALVGQTTQPNGVSWLNLCLQFIDDQAAKIGIVRKRDPTAIADAQDTAAFGPLQSGTPPENALVYFAPTSTNPNGHVGVANKDGTYTSAGISGGVQRLPIPWGSLLGWRYP